MALHLMQVELPTSNIVTRPQPAVSGDGHGNPIGPRCRDLRKEELATCKHETIWFQKHGNRSRLRKGKSLKPVNTKCQEIA